MYITDTNFYSIKDNTIVYNKYVKDGVTNVHVLNDEIVIETSYPVVPCWYYIKNDSHFIMTDSIHSIEKFCADNNIQTTQNIFAIKYYGMQHKSGRNTYKNDYKYIEDFKEIHLKPNGEYTVVPFGFKAFSKDPKDSYEQIEQLFNKYRDIIDEMVTDGVFRPTLTGGLDSRTLIGLYRKHLPEIHDYYLLDVKQDGLNMVIKGAEEVQLSQEVIRSLGCDWTRVETMEGHVTVSSHLNENQCRLNRYVTDHYREYWVDKVVRHYKNTDEMVRWLTDPLYLELKIPCFNFYKCLFAMLLIPDLLDIPLISLGGAYSKDGAYNFYKANKEYIPYVQEVMDYWGKNNCEKLGGI